MYRLTDEEISDIRTGKEWTLLQSCRVLRERYDIFYIKEAEWDQEDMERAKSDWYVVILCVEDMPATVMFKGLMSTQYAELPTVHGVVAEWLSSVTNTVLAMVQQGGRDG